MNKPKTDDGTLLKSTDLFAKGNESEASKKAEVCLIGSTRHSGEWEDMEGEDWTTSEVHEVLTKFIKAEQLAMSRR